MKVTIGFLVALIFYCSIFYVVFGTATAFTLEYALANVSNLNPIENAPAIMQPRVAIPASVVTILSYFVLPAFIVKRKYGALWVLMPGKFKIRHLAWTFISPVIFIFNFQLILQRPFFKENDFFNDINYIDVNILPYVLGIALISPLVEEWFCRGVLYSLLETKIGSGALCSLFTTIPWVLIHWTASTNQIVALIFGGLVFGMIRHATGAIYAGVFVHITYNIMVLVFG